MAKTRIIQLALRRKPYQTFKDNFVALKQQEFKNKQKRALIPRLVMSFGGNALLLRVWIFGDKRVRKERSFM